MPRSRGGWLALALARSQVQELREKLPQDKPVPQMLRAMLSEDARPAQNQTRVSACASVHSHTPYLNHESLLLR